VPKTLTQENKSKMYGDCLDIKAPKLDIGTRKQTIRESKITISALAMWISTSILVRWIYKKIV